MSIYGKFGSPYLGKAQQLQQQQYPFLSMCTVFSCVQTMVWLKADVLFGVFNVRTDVDVCDSTQGGCTDTVRESAPEIDSGEKIPCRTGDSNPRQHCAWLFSLALYQLRYHRSRSPGRRHAAKTRFPFQCVAGPLCQTYRSRSDGCAYDQ